MAIKHSKTANPNDIVASADWNANHIINEIELNDDKKIYFNTAKTRYVSFVTAWDDIIFGLEYIGFEGAMNLYSNTGADGSGSGEPLLVFLPNGSGFLSNTIQGEAANRYFLMEFTDSIRIKTTGQEARLRTTNVTVNRDFEFPNVAGTFITTGNTPDIMVAAPAAANSAGTAGQIAYDTDFFYVCVAANTWKRVAIATW